MMLILLIQLDPQKELELIVQSHRFWIDPK